MKKMLAFLFAVAALVIGSTNAEACFRPLQKIRSAIAARTGQCQTSEATTPANPSTAPTPPTTAERPRLFGRFLYPAGPFSNCPNCVSEK